MHLCEAFPDTFGHKLEQIDMNHFVSKLKILMERPRLHGFFSACTLPLSNISFEHPVCAFGKKIMPIV